MLGSHEESGIENAGTGNVHASVYEGSTVFGLVMGLSEEKLVRTSLELGIEGRRSRPKLTLEQE